MENKIQMLYIHGGNSFKDEDGYLLYLKTREITIEERHVWRDSLAADLGGDFEVIKPQMPLKENARYEDWKIHFEKHFPFIRDNVILVGFSLGGIFLAQYLSENRFPKKLHSVYLIGAPFDGSMPEDLGGSFRLQSDLSLIQENCDRVRLLFSRNDDVVPVNHADMYAAKLLKAQLTIYDHINGHFHVEEFPELIKMLKEDAERIKQQR